MKILDSRFTLNSVTQHEVKDYLEHLRTIAQSQAYIDAFGRPFKGSHVTDIGVERLASIIESQYKPGTFTARTDEFNEEVAPPELIIHDFSQFWREPMGFVSDEDKQYLSVAAIFGHARSGHGAFNRAYRHRLPSHLRDKVRTYSNTTTTDVLLTIADVSRFIKKEYNLPNNLPRFYPKYLGKKIQRTIDDFVEIIDDFFEDPRKYSEPVYLQTKYGGPPFGLGFIRDQPINMLELIRGLVFALEMDGEMRKQVTQSYGLQMGYGSHHITDMALFAQFGLNLEDVAACRYTDELKILEFLPHAKKMAILEELGITKDVHISEQMLKEISAMPTFSYESMKQLFGLRREIKRKTDPLAHMQNIYFREETGNGISDDLAILQSGFLPHTFRTRSYRPTLVDLSSRIIGAYLGDHIDTIQADSNVIFTGGQDETLKQYIYAKWVQALRNDEFVKAVHFNRSVKDRSLISRETLVPFIAMGANFEDGKKGDYDVIHSSQRWFLKQSEGSSAIFEYMKMVRDAIEQYGLEQTPFVHTPHGPVKNDVRLTFEHIHTGNIRREFEERSEYLADFPKQKKQIGPYVKQRMGK